jgi:hypothetical protein
MRKEAGWTTIFWLASAIWIFLSLYFRQDRLYGDTAFYLFNCVNDLKLFVAHDRPVGALVQLAPLFLAKLNAEMDLIIAAMSLNESFLMVLFASIPIFIFRDWRMAVAAMLPLFLGVRWNYFNLVSELIICTPVFIVAMSMLWKHPNSINVRYAFIPAVVFLLINHPLYYLIVPPIYLFLIANRKVPKEWAIIHFLIIAVTIVLKIFNADAYDQNQILATNTSNLGDILWKYFQIDNVLVLLRNVGFLFLLLILHIIQLQKNSLKPVFYGTVLFLVGLFILVLAKFEALFPSTMEPFERYLYPLPLVAGFLFYVYPLPKQRLSLILVGAIILFQSLLIVNYGKDVNIRYMQLSNVIRYAQDHHLSKVVVRYGHFNPHRLGHDWSMTGESLLLSKRIGNKRTVQVSIFESFDADLLKSISPDQYVHFPWWAIDEGELNPEYFYLYRQPTRLINSPIRDATVYNEEYFRNVWIEMDMPTEPLAASKKFIQISLFNNNTIPLQSGDDEIYWQLEGRWMKKDSIIMKTSYSKLLADLDKSLTQLMQIDIPDNKDDVKLKFYLTIREREYFIRSVIRQ